jgi:hypothetical protein
MSVMRISWSSGSVRIRVQLLAEVKALKSDRFCVSEQSAAKAIALIKKTDSGPIRITVRPRPLLSSENSQK